MPVLVRARSAAVLTGVRSVKELLSGFGSGVSLEMVVVLRSVPVAAGSTVPRRNTVRTEPAGNVPSARIPVQGWNVTPSKE